MKRTLDAIDFSGELGAHIIIWPGIEGYNYPFQTPYAESWAWLMDGIGQAAQRCRDHGILLFLEHKNSEPAMKILMRNIGMTLHVIHTLRAQGLDNVKVNMDWQHLLMNDESLAEYAALLAAEGLLGHQHANSGWGTFDDDNMVGATAFMETLELAVELRRAGYGENGERLGFDLYPYTEDAVAAVKRSVLQWRFIDSVAARIDDAALREAQLRKDAVRAYELVVPALGGEWDGQPWSACDVGTTGVKAHRDHARGRRGRLRRGGLRAVDAAAGLVGAGSRGLDARERESARPPRCGCPPRRPLRPDARARLPRRARARPAPGDPVERPAHGSRVRGDRGARRARAFDRA